MTHSKRTAIGLLAICVSSQAFTLQAQTTQDAPPAKPPLTAEELGQLVAPIALYPDSLLTQIFMASTYPLEIVQADRWMKANKNLTGDALAAELEKQPWDASVKSIVNFPDVLDMMSNQLDLTVKLGDAFIAQQADMMNTVQMLRSKAQASGNLASSDQQKIIVEAAPAPAPQTIVVVAPPPQIIRIESPSPTVIYVPTYNPTIVYGAWLYPAYPPYPYYPPRPPGYVAARAVWFGVGVACGVAWGYAWGNCNWGKNTVNININQNVNLNRNINRNNYNVNVNHNPNINGNGNGSWQHNPAHRQGVPYTNQTAAQKYGNASSAQTAQAREAYRGRTDTAAPGSGTSSPRPSTGMPASAGQPRPSTGTPGNAAQPRPSTGTPGNAAQPRPSTGVPPSGGAQPRPSTGMPSGAAQNRPSTNKATTGTTGSALTGVGNSGSAASSASQRGAASRGGSTSAAPRPSTNSGRR